MRVTKPSTHDQGAILAWLKDEFEQTNDGFYQNVDTLKKCFDKGLVRCVMLNDRPLGFAVYRILDTGPAKLSIVEVHPDHRRRGLGTFLVNHMIDLFKGLGASLVVLECSANSEAEAYWRSLGFVDWLDAPVTSSHYGRQSSLQLKIQAGP